MLFDNNEEMKMDGCLEIGIPSAPEVSTLLTCEQNSTPLEIPQTQNGSI